MREAGWISSRHPSPRVDLRRSGKGKRKWRVPSAESRSSRRGRGCRIAAIPAPLLPLPVGRRSCSVPPIPASAREARWRTQQATGTAPQSASCEQVCACCYTLAHLGKCQTQLCLEMRAIHQFLPTPSPYQTQRFAYQTAFAVETVVPVVFRSFENSDIKCHTKIMARKSGAGVCHFWTRGRSAFGIQGVLLRVGARSANDPDIEAVCFANRDCSAQKSAGKFLHFGMQGRDVPLAPFVKFFCGHPVQRLSRSPR